MDLSTINDLQQLKALAYDQIAAKEQAENNLRTINQRIVQLSQVPQLEAVVDPKIPEAPTEQPDAASENENASPAEQTDDNTAKESSV